MDIDQIRQLIQLMVENELTHMDIRDGQCRVSLRRGGADAQMAANLPAAGVTVPVAAAASGPASTPASAALEAPAAAVSEALADASLIQIKSPMVGTFYVAPAPDEPPYINVGTHVSEDSVVCIIAAMKVMNEIKAECRGTITQVLTRNEEAVEYDQPLFLVRPD